MHLSNLKVKAFSSLLFSCSESKRGKILAARAHLHATKHYFCLWLKAIQQQAELRNRFMFYNKRWAARKKKAVLLTLHAYVQKSTKLQLQEIKSEKQRRV